MIHVMIRNLVNTIVWFRKDSSRIDQERERRWEKSIVPRGISGRTYSDSTWRDQEDTQSRLLNRDPVAAVNTKRSRLSHEKYHVHFKSKMQNEAEQFIVKFS